ncbi:MAG: hypothetical protein A2X93_07860 [Deltaproteobacteria bacterium GWC2_56_8]|nr:MAG: hypothetical protein A2X93_07860 [Deltaproteobacteria bacterium GWC2_56_8]
MTITLAVLTAVLAPIDVSATQTIDVNEYSAASVRVSRRQLNRLIAPDVITGIYTNGKGLDVKIDGRNAFVNMQGIQAGDGVELFISAGPSTYTVLLIPADMPGETVVLKIDGGDIKTAVTWEKSNEYVKTIKELIKAMSSDSVPSSGYRRYIVNRKEAMWKEADVTLVAEYQGGVLNGRAYRVKNISNGVMQFGENEFYRTGIRAVAVRVSRLSPGEYTDVYLVGDSRTWQDLQKTPPPVIMQAAPPFGAAPAQTPVPAIAPTTVISPVTPLSPMSVINPSYAVPPVPSQPEVIPSVAPYQQEREKETVNAGDPAGTAQPQDKKEKEGE